MRATSWMCWAVVATGAACGSVTPKNDAAPPIDAAVIDAVDAPPPIDATDAAIDAPDAMPAASPPGQELGAAGGRLTGATFTLDVQLGHPVGQQPIQGATLRLEGNAPIKP